MTLGGTQRLPRLIGVEPALDMMISGQPIDAGRAVELGLLDRLSVSSESLLDEARTFARELLAQQAPAQRSARFVNPGESVAADFFANFRAANQPRWKSRLAPRLVLAAVEAACSLPLNEGLAREHELFTEAEASMQSAALRHVFFAERESGRIPGIGKDIALRNIEKVAVIGAGTMGGGIAMNFVNAGIPVALLELKGEALDRGLANIRKNYEISVKRGKLTSGQLEQRMELLYGTLDYADLADADLVIEAVFEKLEIKQQVFRELDRVCKPGAILASNTSSLDVDVIAATTSRPHDVIGLHFFSPANVMRLLEVVRGQATAADVLATTMKIAKHIGKLPVISGVCFGFIGNRMLEPYSREAHRMVLEGATPAQVDAVLTGIDLNMGVFSMLDLAGIDVNFLVRNSNRAAFAHDDSYCRLGDELYALGRHGQKTGRGFYLYEGRNRQDDYEVVALAERLAGELHIPRRRIDDQEIHDRCLFMLINEGIQLLDEGIALRASDIDLVWINGYGFPAHLGGPLHYAEQLGLDKVLADPALSPRARRIRRDVVQACGAAGAPGGRRPHPHRENLSLPGPGNGPIHTGHPHHERSRHPIHRPYADRQGVPRRLQQPQVAEHGQLRDPCGGRARRRRGRRDRRPGHGYCDARRHRRLEPRPHGRAGLRPAAVGQRPDPRPPVRLRPYGHRHRRQADPG